MKFVMEIFAVATLLCCLFVSGHRVSGISDCRARLDLVIIVDSSLSVGKNNFQKITAFMESLVGHLPVQEDGIRVSLVWYSNKAKVESYLDEKMDQADKLKVVRAFPYRPGSTYTHAALRLTRTDVLTPERGDRPDVPNLIILTTDGASSNQKMAHEEAMTLKAMKDMKIFVIGIGKEVVDDELVNIASRPEMVYKLSHFNQLTNIVEKLAAFSCSDMEENSISELQTWSSSEPGVIMFTRASSEPPTASSTTSSSESPTTTSSSESPTTTSESSTAQMHLSKRKPPHSLLTTQQSLSGHLSTSLSSSVPSSTGSLMTDTDNEDSNDNYFYSRTIETSRKLVSEHTTLMSPSQESTKQATSSVTVMPEDITHASSIKVMSANTTLSQIKSEYVSKDMSTQAHIPDTAVHIQRASSQTNVVTSNTASGEDITTFTESNEATSTQDYSTRLDTKAKATSVDYLQTKSSTVASSTTSDATESSTATVANDNIRNQTSKASNGVSSFPKHSTIKATDTSHGDSQTSAQPTTREVTTTEVYEKITSASAAGLKTTRELTSYMSNANGRTDKISTSFSSNTITTNEIIRHASSLDKWTDQALDASSTTFSEPVQSSQSDTPTVYIQTTQKNKRSQKLFRATTKSSTYPTTASSTDETTSSVGQTLSSAGRVQSAVNKTTSSVGWTKLLANETASTVSEATSSEIHTTSFVSQTVSSERQKTNTGDKTTNVPTVKTNTMTLENDSTPDQIDIDRIDATKSLNESSVMPVENGGDLSSRDVYIFIAGGSATAVILTAMSTFLAVVCRRRKTNRALSGEV